MGVGVGGDVGVIGVGVAIAGGSGRWRCALGAVVALRQTTDSSRYTHKTQNKLS